MLVSYFAKVHVLEHLLELFRDFVIGHLVDAPVLLLHLVEVSDRRRPDHVAGAVAAPALAAAAEAADHFVELKVNEKTKIKHLTNKRWLKNTVTQSTTSTLAV